MIPDLPNITVPIKTDERGRVCVSGTRVTLSSLIHAYLEEGTAQSVHEAFDTVPLADIHAVIAYFLNNREVVEAYLKQQQITYERVRAEMEARFPPKFTKAELLKRLAARENILCE